MATQLDDAAVQAALATLYRRAAEKGVVPRAVTAISVGGCCAAIGTTRKGAFRRKAHAHTGTPSRDPHHGWICVLGEGTRRLVTPTGKPTALLIHEYAHIATREGHTERWRRAVTLLGAPGEAKR